MAAEQIKSTSITNLDAIPIVPNASGQGAPSRHNVVDDSVACSATPLQSTKSFYRLVRIPWAAKIKSVTIATDVALDTGTHALTFDFNIAFSDSTTDGTPAAKLPSSATEAVIPTTANDGVTTTTIASYSSPNKLFGSSNNTSASVPLAPTNILLNGVTSTYTLLMITTQPLWQIFGFVDGRSNPVDPGGYCHLIAYVSTAAGTGAAGRLYAAVSYAV